jgi:hypothetical protein
LWTRPWRKADSNSPSHLNEKPFRGRQIGSPAFGDPPASLAHQAPRSAVQRWWGYSRLTSSARSGFGFPSGPVAGPRPEVSPSGGLGSHRPRGGPRQTSNSGIIKRHQRLRGNWRLAPIGASGPEWLWPPESQGLCHVRGLQKFARNLSEMGEEVDRIVARPSGRRWSISTRWWAALIIPRDIRPDAGLRTPSPP